MPASLRSVTTKRSPTCPRTTGPGAVPLNVHRRCVTPTATSRTTSCAERVSRCVVPCRRAAGSTASRAVNPAGGLAMKSSGAAGPRALGSPGVDCMDCVAPGEATSPWCPATAAAPVTLTANTIPIWRWPTIVHQPSSPRPTIGTSSRPAWPGESRPLCCPVSRARSWTSVSRFTTSTTRRLPAGTSTTAGWKRMARASTRTVVVRPEPVAPADAAAAAEPRAAGSAATPAAMARTTAASPAAARPVCRERTTASASGTCRAAGEPPGPPPSARAREARTANGSSTSSDASAARTRVETTTRTRLGVGRRQTSRPALAMTTRVVPACSRIPVAARTRAGPPPRTTGTR